MSKFLKVIVNMFVLISIVIAAALLIPPFAGIATVMNDNLNTQTNLPVGSVAYGKEMKVKDLKKGDKIIYTEGSSEYIYKVGSLDYSAGTCEVTDPYANSSDTQEIVLLKSVPKVMVVVPFIGYAAIALQSKEGLIVVGLGIVLLIILFILSEIFRKEDDEDDEEDDEDEDDEDEDDEEEKLTRKERRRLKKEEKRRRKLAKKGLLDEEEDEDDEEDTELLNAIEIPQEHKDKTVSNDQELEGFDEAMKEAMSSIAMNMSMVREEETDTPDLDDKIKEESLEESFQEVVEETVVLPIEETTQVIDANAIPKAPTIKELLDDAQKAGEKPEIKKDKENKLTLLDYSDIL